MPVVFEDEQFSFNSQNSQAAQSQRKAEERSSPLNQFIMVLFAVLCLAGAYYLPGIIDPPDKEKVVYFEDITEARMRLVPVKDREAFLNSLPSRDDANQ